MVSMNPGVQASDFRHMYDFVDLRKKKQICTINNDSLMGIIGNNSDFGIFTNIIKKAGYESVLFDIQSDYTIFVPSDEKLRMKYNQTFLDNIGKSSAIKILEFSMMNRKIDQNLLQRSPISIFPTINRSKSIRIKTINDTTIIHNDTTIIHFNHLADNGIIHVIDDLLIPENTI